MTTDERLASIETSLIAVRECLQEIKAALATRADNDRKQIEINVTTKTELKLLRVAVGVALLGGVGGGSSLVLKLLGG